jgi:hypothetical protein
MWKFVVVELYCGIYLNYHKKSSQYYFSLNAAEDLFNNGERVDNPDYDPTFTKPNPPAFCKKMVGVDCLKNNCEHILHMTAHGTLRKNQMIEDSRLGHQRQCPMFLKVGDSTISRNC